MRILMISPAYPPRTGGMETYVAALSREIARRGHQVVVLTNRDGQSESIRESRDGVTILRTRALLDGNGHANFTPWERAYYALLNDIAATINPSHFDVVHCHTQVSLLLAHISGLASRIPLVASFHETNPLRDQLGAERTRFILNSCSARTYIVGSHAFAQQARSFGIPAEKIRIVYMGIEMREHCSRQSARSTLHQMFDIDPAKVMISLIGRFAERKQHRRLLDAYAEMQCRDNVVLVFVGSNNSTDERYIRHLRREIVNLADSNVYMLENVTDTVRDLIVDGTDIGTQPSSAEGLGLAIIELMMAGVPVLVSDVPGLTEAVGGDRAALLSTKDPQCYAAALDRLVIDPKLRSHQGEIMALYARTRFSIDLAGSKILRLYAEACELR